MASSHEKQATHAMQDAARKAAEQTSRVSRVAADAGQRVATESFDIFQQNAATARRTWQSSTDMAVRLTDLSANEFAKLFGLSGEESERAIEQCARNFEGVVQSSNVIARGVQEITQVWLDFLQGRAEQNVQQLGNLLTSRTPQALLAAQSEIMRGTLDGFLRSTQRSAEISTKLAENASRTVGENLEQARAA
jgi:hypothetical protein